MLKKLLLKSIKTVWAIFATGVLLLAVIISLLKVALPYADHYKQDIEHYLQVNFSADVTIGNIGASWETSGPAIVLSDVTMAASEQAPLDISIMETKVDIDFWRSIKEQRLVTGSFQLTGINTYINSDVFFKVRPQSQGSQLFEGLSQLFLNQIQQFQIIDSTVIVRHQDGKNQTFQVDSLAWLNEGNRHRGQGDVFIDGFSDNSLSVRMDLFGQRRSEIFGLIYLEAQQVDITPWLTQFIGEHISVKSTEGNFRVWSDVSDGLVKQILMNVKNTGVRWQKDADDKFLFVDDAALKWQTHGDNWTLTANEIDLKTEFGEPSTFDLNLIRRDNQTELVADKVDLNALTQLFSLFSATKETRLLSDTDVHGVVKNVHVVWPDEEAMVAFVDIQDFSFLPKPANNEAYLGLQGMNLKGAWKANLGRFSMTGAFGEFKTGETFSSPFKYDTFELVTDVRINNDSTEVSLPKIKILNEDIKIVGNAHYLQADTSHLQAYVEVEGPKEGTVNNYLPHFLIGPDTHDYLTKAIKKGRGKLTQVVIDGPPSAIPFDMPEQQGTFIVRAHLTDTLFEFDEEWPALENLDAFLTVDKMNMFIDANSGTIGPLTVNKDVHAKIDLAAQSTVLELDINPSVLPFEQFHELVETTPLKPILGDVFEFVLLEGEGDARVHLSIPLSETINELGVIPQFVARGNVFTKTSTMKLPSLNLEINELASQVSFENAAFSISNATGLWSGLPIDFNVTGNDSLEGYKIDGQVQSSWTDKQLKSQLNSPLESYFSGSTNSSLTLSVNIEGGSDYQYFVDANMDLTDLKYELTGPLKKESGASESLNVSVVGDANSNDIYVDLAEHIKFMAVMPSEQNIVERAILSIGTKNDSISRLLPVSGFNIDINLPAIEFDPTLSFVLDLLDTLPEDDRNSELLVSAERNSWLPAPQKIIGQFDQVSILGQSWRTVSLNAEPKDNEWHFDVNSDDVKARVTIPDNVNEDGLMIKADLLNVKYVAEAADAVTDKTLERYNSSELIRNIPAIKFQCDVCTYNDKPLGKLTFNTFTRDDSLFIEKAQMEYQKNRVTLTGIWAGNSGAGKTTVTGDVYSRYFGPWMLDWGFNSGIKQSDLNSKYTLSWNGAPQDFGFETLNGEVSFELGEGYLSEISDQGARIFSLFSLNSLYRKLKFDFNDVFQKGLFYNDIKGSLLVERGVVYSEDIRMDGVAGNMDMRGLTNLNANTLDYDVTFKPNITSSIPVIAAWLAPGSAGLSLLAGIAIDKIIEKADVVSEVRLKITGDLADPKVQEVKRFTKKVTIPQPKTPEAPEEPGVDRPKEEPKLDVPEPEVGTEQ